MNVTKLTYRLKIQNKVDRTFVIERVLTSDSGIISIQRTDPLEEFEILASAFNFEHQMNHTKYTSKSKQAKQIYLDS